MTPLFSRKPLLAALTLGVAVLLPVASADDSAEFAVEPQTTPLSAIKAGSPTRFTYELKASAWAFILPITGKARFTTELNADTYRITSKVKTTGLADILVNYDLALSATGYVREDGLSPYAYISQNNDGKKNRRVELTWGPADVAGKINPRFGNMGDPEAQPAQKIDAMDPVAALINFALEPRDDRETNPCGGPIKTFDGRQLSHLHLTYAGMKQVRSDAWRGEAIECHITLDKVAGFKAGEKNKDTLAGIDGPLRMWLAPLSNGATVPVRIEADTDDIGKVTLQASVMNFEPLTVQKAER
ncbi:MAG: DUF3108 domain-containing protein [Pseudomonadota bacterium]